MNREKLIQRIDAALGKIPCDLVLKNADIFNVFTGIFQKRNIGILDGVVVAITKHGEKIQTREVVDAHGKWIVPGFIDAHVHLESSLLLPHAFEKMVLPHGTTSAVCDPHEIANVLGVPGIKFFCEAAENLAMDLRVMVPSCVPATHLETNGAGILGAADLKPLQSYKKVLGLAEVMNVPAVLGAVKSMLDKLEAFEGFPQDGHAPMLRGNDLSAYLVSGISSCHESSELSEALEKLEKGMSVWIREGSVAKDLKTLASLLTTKTSNTIGFCTDDRNPLEVLDQGHLDFLAREAIRLGAEPENVFRSMSYSVAQHYGLHRGHDRTGAIAPGFRADLVVLNDLTSVSIDRVLCRGKWTNELETSFDVRAFDENSIRMFDISENDLKGPEGSVRAIQVIPRKIVTDAVVVNSNSSGVAHLSVIERHGNGMAPANGCVIGFGERFNGAIATSVGHDSHNVCVVGSDYKSMTTAVNAIKKIAGGFVVTRGDQILAELPLPIAGLMTSTPASNVVQALRKLRQASHEIGCDLEEPFLQLAFLCLPVIPKLKLTNMGLVDVEKFALVPVAV